MHYNKVWQNLSSLPIKIAKPLAGKRSCLTRQFRYSMCSDIYKSVKSIQTLILYGIRCTVRSFACNAYVLNLASTPVVTVELITVLILAHAKNNGF